MLPFCLGEDLESNDQSWLNRWVSNYTENGFTTPQPCIYAIWRSLYSLPGIERCTDFTAGGDVSSTGFAWVENLLSQAYTKYASQGFILGAAPGSPGFSQWQNEIFPICDQVPGVCSALLTSAASGVTADRLFDNPTSASLFGCYLSPEIYQTYIDDYQISKPCTPYCNRSGVIPAVGPDGVTPIYCTNNICLIDDVTINLINSSVSGNLAFDQVCGGCGSSSPGVTSSCSCIIQGDSITAVNSQINGNISLNQSCTGSVIQCVTTDTNGNKIQTPCPSTGTPTSPYAAEITNGQLAQDQANKTGLWILILIFILIVAIVIIVYFVLKK